MIKSLIFLFIFNFPTLIFGQINFDTTKVKGGVIIDTANRAFYETSNGLIPLAKSVNFIEIGMSVFHAPVGGVEERILSFDGNNWTSNLTLTDFDSYDTTNKNRVSKNYRLHPENPYPVILNELNTIGLFTLPNQEELQKPFRVNDGECYSIAYKIGNKFRQLSFDNPDIYKELYPNTKEFKKYSELINIFYKEFKKE